jgi:Ras family protein A
MDNKKCNVCKKPSTSYCSKCKLIYYCSKECQKKDWKEHKTSCGNSSVKTIETDTKLSSRLNPIWLKIAIIGDSDVGKTTLARRVFCHPQEYDQTFYYPLLPFNWYTLGHYFVYKIYDAIGNFKLGKTDREIEYEDTGAIILCFALDDPQTLINIEKMWIPDVKKSFPHKMPPLLLVGNNKKLRDSIPIIEDPSFSYDDFLKSVEEKRKRKNRGKEFVSREQAEAVANRIGAIGYMQVDPMSKENCNNVFDRITLACIPKVRRPHNEKDCFAETRIRQEPI